MLSDRSPVWSRRVRSPAHAGLGPVWEGTRDSSTGDGRRAKEPPIPDRHEPDARARAIRGLRMIAALEEYVAGEIAGSDGGYFGRLAEHLTLSAADRRYVAAELAGEGDPVPPRPGALRLVT